MSTLKVNSIQHSNGTDAITIDSTGNTSFSGVVTGTPLGNRNLIINGDMNIAQRGTSVTGITSTGYQTIDRFTTVLTTAGTWTQTQDTDVPTGQGFSSSLKMACTTANASLAAGDQLNIQQRIEAQNLQHLKYGTSNAESLTMSFWVKSNKTGTYTFWIYQADDVRAISKTYTIDSADTWEKKTITIEGDTVGVIDNNNDAGFWVGFYLAAGSNFTSGTLNTSWNTNVSADRVSSSQVNLADSTSNYINITGVQLEVGDTATPFEHRPYDMELARCQRYYQKIIDRDTDGTGRMWLWNISGGNLWRRGYIVYTTTMRATPTATLDATAGGGGTFVTTPSFGNSSEKSGAIIADLTTAGDGYYAFVDNLYLDAEL